MPRVKWRKKTYLTRSKCAGLQSEEGVGTDGSQSLGSLDLDVLIDISSTSGRGVLVLLDVCQLGVDRSLVAQSASPANGEGVPLQSTEEDSVGGEIKITSGLGVCQGLVGDDLLQAVQAVVCHITGAVGRSSVAKEGEDSVDNVERIVKLESRVGGTENSLVGVLLGNLTLGGGSPGVERNFAGRSHAGKGNNGRSVLHFEWLMLRSSLKNS